MVRRFTQPDHWPVGDRNSNSNPPSWKRSTFEKSLVRPRISSKSQLGSQFQSTVTANGAGDVAKTNGITGVSVWLIELWGVGYTECFRAKFQADSLSVGTS